MEQSELDKLQQVINTSFIGSAEAAEMLGYAGVLSIKRFILNKTLRYLKIKQGDERYIKLLLLVDVEELAAVLNEQRNGEMSKEADKRKVIEDRLKMKREKREALLKSRADSLS